MEVSPSVITGVVITTVLVVLAFTVISFEKALSVSQVVEFVAFAVILSPVVKLIPAEAVHNPPETIVVEPIMVPFL
ncbi:hypothetical protein D3C80_1075790 [compost metagenome]